MKKLITRLEQLIGEGEEIREGLRDVAAQADKEREDSAMRRNSWILSCKNFFEKTAMERFLKEFEIVEESRSYPSFKMAEYIAVLKSSLNEMNEGFVFKIQHILHADLFDSITDQAEELLKKGHKIPAAVLARIVIEKWLFDIADQNGIDTSDTDKAAVVNDRLKDAVFSTPKWRTIQSHLDTGNSAAHGKDNEFNDSDVKNMFQFIKNNCV